MCGPLQSSQACRAPSPRPALLALRPSSRRDSLGTALGAGTCEWQVPLEPSLASPYAPSGGLLHRAGPHDEGWRRAGTGPGAPVGPARPQLCASHLALEPGPGGSQARGDTALPSRPAAGRSIG